jgi:succinate dehydrogenase / fumarate reductase, cytochrome b subunit
MAETLKNRPVHRNIHVSQIVSYRLPPAGIVSILHRISGAMLFFALPFVIWMFDTSISTEISFERFTAVFRTGFWFFPGWLVKLGVLAILWAYLLHFIAGMRHLWMDATHSVSKEQGHSSAVITLALSSLITLALGAKLFGLY